MWPAAPQNACSSARRVRKVVPSFSSSRCPIQSTRAIRAGRYGGLKPWTTLAALVLAVSGLAQEPALVEVRHPATGRVIALVDPAAARNHGAPLPGVGKSGRLPSARLHAAVEGRAPDATLLAAARRFGLGEPEREMAFQRAEPDGLHMVHEGWEQLWQGVPVFGAGLIVHRNARGAVTSIGGRVLEVVTPPSHDDTPSHDGRAVAPGEPGERVHWIRRLTS